MSERTKRGLELSVTAVFSIALLLLVAVLVFSGGTATAKQIATLRILGGNVQVRHGDEASRPAAEGQSLREGDTVTTGVDGRASVEYFDGSLTILDVGSTSGLSALETIESPEASKVIRSIQPEGNSYNRVVELNDPNSRFEIRTPTATASVVGTEYAVMVGGAETTIVVIEGTVRATSDAGAVDVPGGKMVVIGSDGLIGAVQDIPPELLESEWITFGRCAVSGMPECPPQAEGGSQSPNGQGPSGTGGPPAGDAGSGFGPPDPDVGPAGDTKAPNVRITEAPNNPSHSTNARFAFTSSEPGTGFRCTLDGETDPCGAGGGGATGGSVRYSDLGEGRHTFSISLSDASGNTGSDSYAWTIDLRGGGEEPAFDHLVIAPSTATIELGGTKSYTAEAFDTQGDSMGDVTANTSFSISPNGSCDGATCRANQPGAHTVTGTFSGDSDTAVLMVEEPPEPCPHYALAFHARPPSTIRAGHQFNVQVDVDVLAGGSADGPLTISLQLGGGSFGGGETSQTWTGQGILTFNHLTIDEAGAYAVKAVAACAAPAEPASITVTEDQDSSRADAASWLVLPSVVFARPRLRR